MCPPSDADAPPQSTAWTGEFPHCVPGDDISRAAFRHAATHLHPLILSHSIRVFLLARDLSEKESRQWHGADRLPLLFTACLFHDIGTSAIHNTRPLRFEIEGGDAARALLSKYDVLQADQDEVWTSIVLHNTPQVAERFPGPGLVRLVRFGVMADFKRKDALGLFDTQDVRRWEEEFPRGQIEQVLGNAVVEQAVRCPQKAPPACWPGGLYLAHLEEPKREGVNKAF